MKQWPPLLLRNFLQVSPAYIHFTIRELCNREGLTISPNHTFAKQKIKILLTEREFSHITAPEKEKIRQSIGLFQLKVKGFV